MDIVHGWNVQLSAQMTRRWSLVGELNGKYTGYYDDLAGLGGVRFGWQPTASISPFWQVLVGGLKSTENYVRGDSYTQNIPVLQPGIGVTVMVNPRFGIRGHYDVLVVCLVPRVAVSGVIRLGR